MHSAVCTLMPPLGYESAPTPEDRILDTYLEDWARYTAAPSGEMGYPRRSGPFSTGGYSLSSDEMEQRDVILPRCKAIETIVYKELPPLEAAAIKHRYSIAVFRFPRDNYPEALVSARQRIAVGIRKRNLWGVFA